MSIVGIRKFLSAASTDGSGNGNNAILQNGAFADGNGYISLDNVDDYVEISDAPQYALN